MILLTGSLCFQDVPYIELVPIPGNSTHFDVSGYEGDIWKVLQQILGFDYTVVASVDGKFGAPTANGSFNGMTGMVERNEVDIAISSFFLTVERAQAVDFSNILVPAQ